MCARTCAGARDPSWLSVAAAELLVYGDYFTLTARIVSLPTALPELLADILARLRRESPRLVWQQPSADADAPDAGGALRWIEVHSTRSCRFVTALFSVKNSLLYIICTRTLDDIHSLNVLKICVLYKCTLYNTVGISRHYRYSYIRTSI